MATETNPPPDLIPGYTVTERLGAGGYGEVWKAEAPGGLAKAIKLVYGYMDDDHAARELKALNRVKQMRHPFLLSLERIEVIDGRLMIVTELADRSLMDRFDECRADQMRGIPRDELLAYLRDAADALDYMREKFSLQHLDIKPENLLLVGDHVKVADFGLVKELMEKTNSMVGGMTPVYASPEIFDGRPSQQSDQYSLAIVFQEMLTGVLPFPGQTAAQLANQHLNGRPRLTPLQAHDRACVARALEKNPESRYSGCRELIDQLQAAGKRQQPSAADDDARSTDDDSTGTARPKCDSLPRMSDSDVARTEALLGLDKKSSEAKKRSSRPAARVKSSPAAVGPDSIQRQIRVSRELKSVAPPQLSDVLVGYRPTLLIGLGGTGARLLQSLRLRLDQHFEMDQVAQSWQMLLLDTDRATIKSARLLDEGPRLAEEDAMLLPLRRPQEYRNVSSKLLAWLSRRWLYNIPRSLETQGFRPLGRLALVGHAERVKAELRDRLTRLVDPTAIETLEQISGMPCRSRAPRIFVVGATGGGTGSGMLADVGFYLRQLLEEFEVSTSGLCGIAVHATNRQPTRKDLAIANTYACLTELAHFAAAGRAAEATGADYPSEGSAFDTTYFVNFGDDLRSHDYEQQIELLADYLFCDMVSPAGPLFDACRSGDHGPDRNSGWQVRSLGLCRFDEREVKMPLVAAEVVEYLVTRRWLKAVKPPSTRRSKSIVETTSGHDAPTVAQPPEEIPLPVRLEQQLTRRLGPSARTLLGSQYSQLLIDALANSAKGRANAEDLLASVEPEIVCVATAIDLLRAKIGYPKDFGQQSEGPAIDQSGSRLAAVTEFGGPLAEQLAQRLPQVAEHVAGRLASLFFRGLLPCGKEQPTGKLSPKMLLEGLVRASRQAVVREIQDLSPEEQLDEEGRFEMTADRLKDLLSQSRMLPECGGEQRLIVARATGNELSLQQPLQENLGLQASEINAPIEHTLLVAEANKIAAAQIAHRLTEYRADLVDAARRLHTRVDINWTPLPTVIEPQGAR